MTEFYYLLRNAFQLYVNRWRYVYFYGAKGELMTEPVMNQLIETYPEFWAKYSPEEIADIKNVSRGRIGLDCSGFITMISGIYGNSAMLFDKCVDKTTPRDGKAGYMLYKPNHVSIDIGYGYCMEIGTPKETFIISKISDRDFIASGALPDYDYRKAGNF